MSELSPNATVDSRNGCPMRDTPRADALWEVWEKDSHGATKYAAMYLLARELENDLELCRDAHMANCLAADTLRAEIRALRSASSATASADERRMDYLQTLVRYIAKKGEANEAEASMAVDGLECPLMDAEGDLRAAIDRVLQ